MWNSDPQTEGWTYPLLDKSWDMSFPASGYLGETHACVAPHTTLFLFTAQVPNILHHILLLFPLGTETTAHYLQEGEATGSSSLLLLPSPLHACSLPLCGKCWGGLIGLNTTIVEDMLKSCDKAAFFRPSCVTFENFYGHLMLFSVLCLGACLCLP